MNANPRVLAVICARGGSKGLPGKNLLPLGGQPMVAWSVAAARRAATVSRVIISTDDPAIADAAKLAGCEVPFLRPAELSTDEATLDGALIHALDTLGGKWDALVLLQAATPFRSGADIDAGVSLLLNSNAPTTVSMAKAPKPPQWMYAITDDGHISSLLGVNASTGQRQTLPQAYVPNGAVYVVRPDRFRATRVFYEPDTLAFIMPPERSVDVDTPLDFAYAKAVLESAGVSFPME